MDQETNKPPQEKSEGPSDYFYVKMPASPQVGSAEADKMEQQLLAKFKAQGPRAETLKPLAIFYSRVGQQERAYQYLKMWMKYAKNQEELAECLLMSGQLAEQIGQSEPAIAFYQEALAQQTPNNSLTYYLHNNLAFCLNARGEYEKAMRHCETAVQLDPSRSNAFKNLGVSQAGLGRFSDAARTWIRAMHVDASDRRALDLLEKLITDQREAIQKEIPDIDEKVAACERAAGAAQSGRFADWAKGLTLN